MDDTGWSVRAYEPQDRSAVRAIYGVDEFARPELLARYPGMSEYLADEVATYFLDHAPQSTFVAEVEGRVVAALLGCADTREYNRFYRRRVRPLVLGRCLLGTYGWPGWASAIVRTEWASRHIEPPAIDLELYPAHLHIGVLPSWRRWRNGCGVDGSIRGSSREPWSPWIPSRGFLVPPARAGVLPEAGPATPRDVRLAAARRVPLDSGHRRDLWGGPSDGGCLHRSR